MSTVTAELPVLPAPESSGVPAAPAQAPPRPRGSGPGRPAAPEDAPSPAAVRRDPWRQVARLSPLLALALSIAMVWWGLGSGTLSSLESLRAFIGGLGAWGPVVFMAVSVALVVFPVIPGGLPVIAAPLLFGPVLGSLYTYLAVCTGLILNVSIGRYVGLGMIQRLFSTRTLETCLGWTRHPRFHRFFATAIALPVAPDDLLCYVAGTTRMRWRTAVTVILVAKPWSLLLYGLGVSTLLLQVLPW